MALRRSVGDISEGARGVSVPIVEWSQDRGNPAEFGDFAPARQGRRGESFGGEEAPTRGG